MGNLQRSDVVHQAGRTTRTEILFRVTTHDGRINDHGPYIVGRLDQAIAAATMGFRCPLNSTITKLTRTVTVEASEWTPVEEAK